MIPGRKNLKAAEIFGLDELRGLAVIAVMASHLAAIIESASSLKTILGTPALGVGVDLFFVISGFVISRQLLAIPSQDRWRGIQAFWIRRVARIAPMAWTVIAIVGLVTFFAPEGTVTRGDLMASALFYANGHWAPCFEGFPGCGSPLMLSHFWSLALELQFYALAPLLVLLPRHWFRPLVLVVLFLGAFTLRPWGGSLWAFRPDALLLGALLASERVGDREFGGGALLGPPHILEALLIIVVAGVFARFAAGAASGAVVALIALLFTMLVLRVVAAGPVLSFGYAGRALRAVGAISFALYLVHLPIFTAIAAISRHRDSFELSALACLAVSTIAAMVLNKFVGEPWRAAGRRYAARLAPVPV